MHEMPSRDHPASSSVVCTSGPGVGRRQNASRRVFHVMRSGNLLAPQTPGVACTNQGGSDEDDHSGAGFVTAISLAPASSLAQTNINGPSGRPDGTGTTQPSDTTDRGSSGATSPGTTPRDNTTPRDDRTKTSDTPSTIQNKAACERAGGKWHDVDRKCGM